MAVVRDQDVSILSGTRTHGPFNIPNGADLIDIRISRQTDATPDYWNDPATTLSYDIQISYDGGANWVTEASVSVADPIPGGILNTSRGQSPYSRITLQGLLTTPNRQLRVRTRVQNGPLATHLWVNIE